MTIPPGETSELASPKADTLPTTDVAIVSEKSDTSHESNASDSNDPTQPVASESSPKKNSNNETPKLLDQKDSSNPEPSDEIAASRDDETAAPQSNALDSNVPIQPVISESPSNNKNDKSTPKPSDENNTSTVQSSKETEETSKEQSNASDTTAPAQPVVSESTPSDDTDTPKPLDEKETSSIPQSSEENIASRDDETAKAQSNASDTTAPAQPVVSESTPSNDGDTTKPLDEKETSSIPQSSEENIASKEDKTETAPAATTESKLPRPIPTELEEALSPLSPTRSTTEHTNSPAPSAPVAAPELGPGWTVVIRHRKATATRGSQNLRTYLTPINKFKMLSRPMADRFLAALATVDGDESRAYSMVRRGSNKTSIKKEKGKPQASPHAPAKKRGRPRKDPLPEPKNQPADASAGNMNLDWIDDPPPKRPPSTYVTYTAKLRSKVMAENPTFSSAEISRLLGQIWKAVPPAEKEELKAVYFKDLEAYQKKMKEWELRNPGKPRQQSKKKKRPENDQAPAPKKSKRELAKDTEWWEVEGFRDRRINESTGKEEYLIKWRGCPESSNTWEPSENLNVQDDALAWWKYEEQRRNNEASKQQRINESMKRLGLDGEHHSSSDDDYEESDGEAAEGSSTKRRRLSSAKASLASEVESTTEASGASTAKKKKMVCRRNEAPPQATKQTKAEAPLVEDETWNWEDTSQVNFRTVQRISVHEPNARKMVTEARINGTPVVLTGHVGWANFALRWLRRRGDSSSDSSNGAQVPSKVETGVNGTSGHKGERENGDQGHGTNVEGDAIPMEVSGEENTITGGNGGDTIPMEVEQEKKEATGGNTSTTNETTDVGSKTFTTLHDIGNSEAISNSEIKEGGDSETIKNGSKDVDSTPSTTIEDNPNSIELPKVESKELGDAKPTKISGEGSAPASAQTTSDASEQVVNRDDNTKDRQNDANENETTAVKTSDARVKEEHSKMDDSEPRNGAKDDKNDSTPTVEDDEKPLDLSDPSWYLDINAMSNDIGDEEVPVVKKNYNESKPISGNILASDFFEVGWNVKKERSTAKSSRRKKQKAVLYLHQWQFPLSLEACKKLCHQSIPLPNFILGEDLLKYWLDRVKLDSPLQYLFMGNADTMSRIHRDNGGLAISIAPITGQKECVLVHRDDGHACLYHNQAPLDPDDIDLNAYPLLPHARIWRTTIKPGEILLMPHGTYHQCRNVTPCLSYSRFHLDGVNLRAFLHSMMDGDAPELCQDVVLWNATRELVDVVDKASDQKLATNEELVKAVDALRALRNIAKEVTRKLLVRQTVKGMDPASPVVSSSVNIDGDAGIWQSLVDDVDMSLHEFRYRFNRKIPTFKCRRSIGRKVLAMPALPFRGKSKPSQKQLTQGRNEPVVAFECPTDRGYLALPQAPLEIPPTFRKKVDDTTASIVAGDDIVVRIEGRRCPARVTEIMENLRVAWVSFEDLPSVYNDFVPCDLLRVSSVGGSCLAEPPPEDIKPGKLFVCLMGKDEYRGVIQYVKCGRMFRSKLDLGNGHSIDRLIDSDSILAVTNDQKRSLEEICPKEKEEKRGRKRTKMTPSLESPAAVSEEALGMTSEDASTPSKTIDKKSLPKILGILEIPKSGSPLRPNSGKDASKDDSTKQKEAPKDNSIMQKEVAVAKDDPDMNKTVVKDDEHIQEETTKRNSDAGKVPTKEEKLPDKEPPTTETPAIDRPQQTTTPRADEMDTTGDNSAMPMTETSDCVDEIPRVEASPTCVQSEELEAPKSNGGSRVLGLEVASVDPAAPSELP